MKIADTLGEVSREETGSAPGLRSELLASHVAIIDAMRSHDPDAAEAAMVEHLDLVEAALREA